VEAGHLDVPGWQPPPPGPRPALQRALDLGRGRR
jgi:hypothetical protein